MGHRTWSQAEAPVRMRGLRSRERAAARSHRRIAACADMRWMRQADVVCVGHPDLPASRSFYVSVDGEEQVSTVWGRNFELAAAG